MDSLINYTLDSVLSELKQFIWSFLLCSSILANPWILYLYIHHRLKKILLSHHIYSKQRLQFKILASCWCVANTDLEEKLQLTPRYNKCEMRVTTESSPWHHQHSDLTSAENLNKEIFKSLGLSDKEGPNTLPLTLTQSPQAI